MPRPPGTGLSRRDAIALGIGAAAAATINRSVSAADSISSELIVDGVVNGQPATFLIEASTGQMSQIEAARPGSQFVVQPVRGDLSVRDEYSKQSALSLLNSLRQRKDRICVSGSVLEAVFAPNGHEIVFLELDEALLRLVSIRPNGRGRRVLSEVDQSGGMRGISWSPCSSYVAVVAYDWEQFGDTVGCPAEDSHTIELHAVGAAEIHRATRIAKAAWLGRIQWTNAAPADGHSWTQTQS